MGIEQTVAGFASRKGDISVYLLASGAEQEQLLEKLGKHKRGKSCLYIKRPADIDTKILQQLIICSVAEVKRQYG